MLDSFIDVDMASNIDLRKFTFVVFFFFFFFFFLWLTAPRNRNSFSSV